LKSRQKLATAAVVCLGVLFACTREITPSGDEVIGSFEFISEPPSGSCVLSQVPTDAGLAFSATFSLDSRTQTAWMSIGGVEREVVLDGGRMTAKFRAQRVFTDCSCTVELEETLDVIFLSRSQNDALLGRCPEGALDGGIPVADGDAGIRPAGAYEDGYDALRACGELTDELIVPAGCDCGGTCLLKYPVSGLKQ